MKAFITGGTGGRATRKHERLRISQCRLPQSKS
jgi:hypothetical protein